MCATLPLFQAMIQDDMSAFKDLVPSFVSILKQITDHRLPKDYDYHRIPSPWIQVRSIMVMCIVICGVEYFLVCVCFLSLCEHNASVRRTHHFVLPFSRFFI